MFPASQTNDVEGTFLIQVCTTIAELRSSIDAEKF